MAACLWGGDTAAASHRSAAALWSLRGFSPAAVEISSCLNRRSSHLPFTAHRVDRFLLEEVGSEIKGIPVTSVRRTLLDVAGAKDPRTEPALDHALLHQLTSLGQMWLLYDQEWTRGRRGIAILRSLLIERTGNRAPTQSELEDRMWRLIQTRALPTPIAQFPIRLPDRVIHVDFCYPDERLVIELDGYAWHGDRRAFEEDRARDNALQALGWRVVRITWAKLRFDPDGVEALLRTYLNLAPVPSAY